MLIKVCGLNNRENIFELCKMNIDFIGFIFFKNSSRYFNKALSFDEARQIPKSIKKVGVFVNESVNNVLNTVAHYDLDFVQLHGDENPAYCKELFPYVKIIKTISVKDKTSFKDAHHFSELCNYFLFDTATSNYGGSGNTFDWALLKDTELSKPAFLSGGISLINFSNVKNIGIKNLIAIDVNSKFEIVPGTKKLDKINLLIKENNANKIN